MIEYSPLRNRNILPITLASTALAVSGCAANNSQETEPAFSPDEITQTASQSPQGECSLHFVKPNAYLRDQKSSALAKDLGVLSVINSKDKKAKIRDTVTASGIIFDSYRDPVYAQAITKANQDLAKGKRVTVKQLKATKTDKLRYCEDKNHISKKRWTRSISPNRCDRPASNSRSWSQVCTAGQFTC